MFQSAFIALCNKLERFLLIRLAKKCAQRGPAAIRGSSLDTNTAALAQTAAGRDGRGQGDGGAWERCPTGPSQCCASSPPLPARCTLAAPLGPTAPPPAPPSLLRFGSRGGAPISPTRREAALAAAALSRWSGIKRRRSSILSFLCRSLEATASFMLFPSRNHAW